MFALTTRIRFPRIILPKRLTLLFKNKKEIMTTTAKEKLPAQGPNFCAIPAPQQQSQQISATSDCNESSETCEKNVPCEDAVREKAYLLWEQAGYPEGDGSEFWLEAEKQLKE